MMPLYLYTSEVERFIELINIGTNFQIKALKKLNPKDKIKKIEPLNRNKEALKTKIINEITG
jgi:hypothetical protein